MGGHPLHEDVRRGLDERKSGGEDDAGDDKRDTWVKVESPSALAASCTLKLESCIVNGGALTTR